MTAITSKAPGKTILFGEHAVVYGYPAIAVPINSVQMKINIQAEPTQPADAIHILNRGTGQNVLVTDLPEQDPIRATLRIIGTELKIDHYPAATVSISSTIPIASGLGSSAALAVALIRSFSNFSALTCPIRKSMRLPSKWRKSITVHPPALTIP
jgi:mevalonate kinase